jgi:hypothetical protein
LVPDFLAAASNGYFLQGGRSEVGGQEEAGGDDNDNVDDGEGKAYSTI